jgi:hypothetical protein
MDGLIEMQCVSRNPAARRDRRLPISIVTTRASDTKGPLDPATRQQAGPRTEQSNTQHRTSNIEVFLVRGSMLDVRCWTFGPSIREKSRLFH